MKSLCLLIARMCLFAWVGAAVLFVVTSVAEQRHDFDSLTRNALAALRFPYYYQFGFAFLGTGFVCSLLAWNHAAVGRIRLILSLLLMLGALCIMIGDYIVVYRPLLAMMSQETKPADFTRLHELSKQLNAAGLGLALLAGLLIGWTGQAGRENFK